MTIAKVNTMASETVQIENVHDSTVTFAFYKDPFSIGNIGVHGSKRAGFMGTKRYEPEGHAPYQWFGVECDSKVYDHVKVIYEKHPRASSTIFDKAGSGHHCTWAVAFNPKVENEMMHYFGRELSTVKIGYTVLFYVLASKEIEGEIRYSSFLVVDITMNEDGRKFIKYKHSNPLRVNNSHISITWDPKWGGAKQNGPLTQQFHDSLNHYLAHQ